MIANDTQVPTVSPTFSGVVYLGCSLLFLLSHFQLNSSSFDLMFWSVILLHSVSIPFLIHKYNFVYFQTEVEESTEVLSQMVARPYLRTPRAKIIQTTQLLHRKRVDFLLALTRGLLPDDDAVTNSYASRWEIEMRTYCPQLSCRNTRFSKIYKHWFEVTA